MSKYCLICFTFFGIILVNTGCIYLLIRSTKASYFNLSYCGYNKSDCDTKIPRECICGNITFNSTIVNNKVNTCNSNVTSNDFCEYYMNSFKNKVKDSSYGLTVAAIIFLLIIGNVCVCCPIYCYYGCVQTSYHQPYYQQPQKRVYRSPEQEFNDKVAE